MTETVIERTFHLRGPFLDLFTNNSTETLLAGPAGTGKSTAGLIFHHMMALTHPNLRILFARKTMESLTKSTLITYQEHVANDTLKTGDVVFFGGNLKEPPGFRYSNGSRISLGGLDDPERIKSTEFDLIFVDEATDLALKDWQVLTTRLRGHVLAQPKITGACNPAHPEHWLKKRANAGTLRLMETRHEHNPAYYDDEGAMTPEGKQYIAILDNLTGLEYKRLRQGLWVAAEGIIYDMFDPAKHVVPWFDIPSDWARYWAIDFGYDHAFVWQSWAEDPDGVLYLYREWYMTHMIVEDHAKKMRELTCRKGDPEAGEPEWVWVEPRPYAIICDHDAEGRATLAKHLGMGTTAARKEVLTGIQAVANRLATNRLRILEGYQVTRDERLLDKDLPTCFTEEIPGYVWDESAGSATRERPVKEKDHGCDPARYMAMYREPGRAPNVRWLNT